MVTKKEMSIEKLKKESMISILIYSAMVLIGVVGIIVGILIMSQVIKTDYNWAIGGFVIAMGIIFIIARFKNLISAIVMHGNYKRAIEKNENKEEIKVVQTKIMKDLNIDPVEVKKNKDN